jgi:tRNA-splicing ligase RtcB
MHHMPAGSPFEYYGSPVIIPGSMGSSSYLLAGEGNDDLLSSACHGAGRSLTRKDTQKVDEADYLESVSELAVVTAIDPELPEIKSRRDILEAHHSRLREEAPFAYKPITPIIESVEKAGVARAVARLWPLATVKG